MKKAALSLEVRPHQRYTPRGVTSIGIQRANAPDEFWITP